MHICQLNMPSVYQQHGLNAVSMTVAEQYIAAFSNLAKETNTVLLPSNSGDVSSMVSQVRRHIAVIFVLILQLGMFACCIFRLTSPSRPNKLGLKCPSVRLSVYHKFLRLR